MGLADRLATGSPFWLRLNGTWIHLEGVARGVDVGAERPASEVVTIDGHRYVQKAPQVRREWSLGLEWASAAAVSALRVAAEAGEDDEVLLYSAATANMLKPSETHGDGSVITTLIDCGGIPLRAFNTGTAAAVPVRNGRAYTIAFWSTAATTQFNIAGPFTGTPDPLTGASGSVRAVQRTMTADGTLTVTSAGTLSSGLMVFEGSATPTTFAAGESMPCPVSVADPADVLQRHAYDAWRHDYSITLREVG